MAAPLKVWSVEELQMLQKLYIERGLPAGECHRLVVAKFKGPQTLAQTYRAIESRGWRERRNMLAARVENIIGKSNGKLVEKAVKSHQAAMDEFVESSAKGARKAFRMVEDAASARELNAAASAAKSLVTTMRLCAGIDSNSNTNQRNTFNFNFAASPAKPDTKAAESVAVPEEEVVEV